jgi:putative zinc finger/helix-turn-helix YgiT family protein
LNTRGKLSGTISPPSGVLNAERVFWKKATKSRLTPLIYNFQAKIDGRLTTDDILRIRKRSSASHRKKRGSLLEAVPNAFSRYETGKSYPTKALENFLRALDRHPEDIEELRRDKIAA